MSDHFWYYLRDPCVSLDDEKYVYLGLCISRCGHRVPCLKGRYWMKMCTLVGWVEWLLRDESESRAGRPFASIRSRSAG
jgi:hypothetical protein